MSKKRSNFVKFDYKSQSAVAFIWKWRKCKILNFTTNECLEPSWYPGNSK